MKRTAHEAAYIVLWLILGTSSIYLLNHFEAIFR